LEYYIGPGTLALVHDNRVKGSHLAAKTRFGVGWGMEGDIVIFKCPYSKSKFRSKSYTTINLPNYINFYQFLSIPQPKSKNISAHMRPKDFKINIDEKAILSNLPNHREWEGDRLKDIKFLDRINYESDDENDGEVEGDKNVREYTLTKSKRSGGGECLNLNPSNQNPSQNPPPSISTNTPQESRKRYRENDGYQIKLKSGQLPQKDYELKGEEYVGREILRKFTEGIYRGVVAGTEIDKDNGDELWVIE